MLSDSNKRTIRTLVHGIIAAALAVPTFGALLVHATQGTPIAVHVAALLGTFAVWTSIVAGVLNKLEDLGVIPAWLRPELSVFSDTTPKPPVEVQATPEAPVTVTTTTPAPVVEAPESPAVVVQTTEAPPTTPVV